MNKRLTTEYFNKFRNGLAKLYPMQQDIQSIMVEAGLQLSDADLNGSGKVVWYAVLSLAESENKLAELLQIPLRKYPSETDLVETQQAFENGSAFVPELTLTTLMYATPPSAVKVFFVYDNQDDTGNNSVIEQFRKQLKLIWKHTPTIKLIDMHKELLPGMNKLDFWSQQLRDAQVVLLGISPNFTSRDDNDCDPLAFHASEMKKKVVPVLLENCLWKRVQFLKNIVPLPKDGSFVSDSPNKSLTLMEITLGIENLVLSINPPKNGPNG